MHCVRKVTEDLVWVGGNDRRLSVFEGVYKVPTGISYNSYLFTDEKTILFDTVDASVEKVFFENIQHTLNGRKLDYVVVLHMEPDHSATLSKLLEKYPDVKVVCNQKTKTMIEQFFGIEAEINYILVKEGETLCTGRHEFSFVMAPMVHWPEVMVAYDSTDKILFSADAFGTFGALNGALFADEVDFEKDYMDEARRYYCNIVGKYGVQVQGLLKKAAALDIKMVCPLHGFVWRKDFDKYLEKYNKWSTFTPEENGVLIAYASIYGNTQNAAEILACKLNDKGIKTVMYDTSVTEPSYIVAAAFRYSHIVIATPTYNGGIFVTMENFLHDLAAHNIQNRTAAIMENGTWAAVSGKMTAEILAKCKNITLLENKVSIKSSLNKVQEEEIDRLAEEIEKTM